MRRSYVVLLTIVASLAWALPAGATTYGPQRLIPHQPNTFLFPTSLAVDGSGNLFIGDSYNASVWRIAPDGTQTRISPPYPSSLGAYGVAVDANGELYVSGAAVVWQVDPPDWLTYRQVHMGNVESPEGMAVDNQGDLFVVDSFYGIVLEYDFATGVTTQLPFPQLDTPFYDHSDFVSGPTGLARDSAGDLFVTDTARSQVVELSATGVVSIVPFQGLLWPKGIAVDSAGDLFVADSGNGRVVELTPGGVQTTLPFTSLGSWSGNPQGDVGGVDAVAVDAAGDVFALDRGPGQIWEISPASPQAITFTSTPPSGAVVGGSYTVSASGGGSGNPVTFAIDSTSTPGACTAAGSTISFTGAGTCVVDADQAGSATFIAAPEVQQSFTIARTPQAIVFTSTPPTGAVVGGSYTVSATGGGSGNPVAFGIDSTSTPGACTAAGPSIAFTGAGLCVVDADQSGNTAYTPAPEVQQSFTIAPAPQTITFTSTAPPGAVVGGSYTVSATGGGSGNPVTFTTATPSTCSVSGAIVSFAHTGICAVDADQPGGSGYLAAPEVQQSVAVGKGTPAVSWSTPAAIDFGTALGAGQLDATASVPGTFAYTPAAGTILQPGPQTLSTTFTPADSADWNSVTVSVQLAVNTTQPPITTTSTGPLNIAPGGSVAIAGGRVTGPVTIGAGGALYVSGGSITGPLTVGSGGVLVIDSGNVVGPIHATGGAEIMLCGSTVTGSLSVTGSSGVIRIGATTGCAGNTIIGPATLTGNTGGVSFVGNHVTGSVTITGNRGGFSYSGNTVIGHATVSGNT